MAQRLLRKSLTVLVAVLLVSPMGYAQQQTAPAQQPANEQQNSANPPDAPSQSAPALESRPQSSDSNRDQQPENNKPLGTATAPYEKASGIAASRPAGAVIAPAKQRRVHTFLIRIGIVVGAAAAVGAVAALSHSSPSQPH